jgi:hypothetical protein
MGRVLRITAGSTLLMAGTVMLVLPGPGLLTIAAGVSILARDVPWAQRLKGRFDTRLAKPAKN